MQQDAILNRLIKASDLCKFSKVARGFQKGKADVYILELLKAAKLCNFSTAECNN